jgi:phosphoglycerol transferase MdoB-like AlkP superfamily enzyme
MNTSTSAMRSRLNSLPAYLKTYSGKAMLFLTFLILAAFYELFLNVSSNKETLPLFTVSISIILNSLLYWIKLYLLLLIPFLLLRLISKKLATVFYFVLTAMLVLIQIGLVQYFNTTLVPLGADLFAYSLADIKQTLNAAGGVNISIIISMLLFMLLYGFSFFRFSKKITPPKFLSLGLTVFSIVIFISGFTYSVNGQSLKTEYAKALVLNKSDFFMEKSVHHFFAVANEVDIYADNYSGDYGNGSTSIQDFVYVNEKEYPFLQKDETPDVLSPFFNQSDRMPNIVIILVEGLGRAFSNSGAVLGNFTPFLDSLSNESLYWKNFLSSGGRSFAVLPSVLGSLPFAKNGFNELGENMPAHLSLLSLARLNGYQTSFYYGGDSKFDNMDIFVRKNAIHNIYDANSFPAGYTKLPSKNGFSWGYGDHELFRRYMDLQKPETAQPKLSVLFTVSTHSPFLINNQEKYEKQFDHRMKDLGFSAEQQSAYQAYKSQYASVLFFDDALKTFFDKYKQNKDFDNTIFLITGDHRLPEIPMITKMDRYHVPFLIYSPLLKRKAEFSSVSSHFDIAPSLMAYLQNAYGFQKPSLASWIGSGLDTTRTFSNKHQYPLMQTKNEVIDFVQGDFHLNAESVFSLTSTMDEEPVQDKSKQLQLKGALNMFKNKNEQLIKGAALIPDSIYRKYYPR